MKHFFLALKKLSMQKRATYINSEYKLHKKEKQSLLIGLSMFATPLVIGLAVVLLT